MSKYTLKAGRLVKLETVPITSCDGCGACCRHMGEPGYGVFHRFGDHVPDRWKRSPDYQRWLGLPPAVKAELQAYYDGVTAGTVEDRTRNYGHGNPATDIPCLWYDAETKACRHYEHRPEVCRDAVAPGDAVCRATRRAYRIPLPTV